MVLGEKKAKPTSPLGTLRNTTDKIRKREMASSCITTHSEDKENCSQNASTIANSITGSKMAGRHLTREYSVLDLERDPDHCTKTIGLFGAETKTGNEFLRLALDAGYAVRAMSLPDAPSRSDFGGLEWIRADSLYDKEAIEMVVQDADFVVCMINAESATAINDEEKYPIPASIDLSKPVTSFIEILYPLMRNQKSIQVFLYQASSLASDTRGKTPILSRVLKSVKAVQGVASHAIQRNQDKSAIHVNELSDHDTAIRHIGQCHRGRRLKSIKGKKKGSFTERAAFQYIVTRPTTFLTDQGPSSKKISASKSQPGPFPISHADLAEFSLNALVTKKLQNSCPYIVADSF